MLAIDYRNSAFKDIQARVCKLRAMALKSWQLHGPGTTKEVARKSGLDILTFRPRTTELYQLGFVVLVEGEGKEGCYRAATEDEARATFEAKKDAELQPELLFV